MRNPSLVGISLFFLSLLPQFASSQNSVLSEGNWYKVAVDKSGVYKLSRSFLTDIGIDVEGIDPKTIKVYGNPGGILPQANNVDRPQDLLQNAIMVTGEGDGSFDGNDLVIFYADGPDSYSYDEDGVLTYEQNFYSKYNYYFITVGGASGLRVENSPNQGSGFPIINKFDDFSHHELTSHNILISGREWYGEKFDLTTQYTISFEAPGIINGSEIKVYSDVMAQSYAQSEFIVSLNGSNLGSHEIASVPNFDENRYRVKGRHSTKTFSGTSNGSENLSLVYDYKKNSSGKSTGYLNYVTTETQRALKAYSQQTVFRSLESIDNSNSTFEVDNASSNHFIWNITEKISPKEQTFQLSGSKAIFGTISQPLQEFVIFTENQLLEPEFVEQVNNQNIRSYAQTNLLIVTHPNFLNQAQQLASFRSSHDKLSTAVVTTAQVYNEFSSGRKDVSAIRDYIKHLYDKGSGLKYVLLFGRGSYDYLDNISNNTNYVPIYESRNSLHPLETYASDDFYGFMEEDEGEWLEQSGGNHTMEVGIGRLPVSSTEEASQVVNKLINYSTDAKNYGSWRNEITFVADDGDLNLHQGQADKLAQFVDTTFTTFNSNKLYLDAFKQISKPNGEISPEASQALNKSVESGSLIVNFTGHGGETGWMQEQVLDLIMINEWDNQHNLPLFVTATCEFSRHDNPRSVSGGELVLTNPLGGGIGIVSTCRPVYANSNFELNKAFFNAVFNEEDNQPLRMGDIVRITKNNSIDLAGDTHKVGNRNFSLLGDPSLLLAFPKNDITISSIQSEHSSDTLSALSSVTLSGEVTNSSGIRDMSFNGTVKAIIYDKESLFTTMGNENSPFNYYAKENVLFRGSASVSDGQFSFDFVVPKNITYQFGEGKISLYAVSEGLDKDASGSDATVIIGGSNPAPLSDNQGPDIELYLGDSTNTSLTDIASNTQVVAKLFDENGINISGYGVGNSITIQIDDGIEHVANNFFNASKDTYKQGWVVFPLEGLEKGQHTLTFKAWDTFNNSSTQELVFHVLDPNKLSISKLINYPNPFTQTTTISFQHNRAGEDLQATAKIISRLGEVIHQFNFDIKDSPANIDLLSWDGTNQFGRKLDTGVYLVRIEVRSKKDGATNEKYDKLILIN